MELPYNSTVRVCNAINLCRRQWHLTILDRINLISSSVGETESTTLKKIWQKSTENENLIASQGSWIDLVVEVAKSVGKQSFDDMTTQDIQELLVKEETGEAG